MIVDKFILNFVVNYLIDKIVFDTLLEGHPLLLIMILQDFLVPGKTHFMLVEGSDEQYPGSEEYLRNVRYDIPRFCQQTVLYIFSAVLFLV